VNIMDPGFVKDVAEAIDAAAEAPVIAYAALVAELVEAGALDQRRIADRAADPGLPERTRAVLRRYVERLARVGALPAGSRGAE
jgi:hypothetical protein